MRCTGRQTGWRISSGEEVRHFWARDFARCGVRGTCAVRRGNKKGRHLRFLPSLNTRFPCGVAWVQMVGCVSVEKGGRQRIFSAAWYNTVSHFGCRTATQTVKLTQARHDSAAQRFYLCRLSKLLCPRAGRRNVSLYRGATPRSDRRTACAFRAHRTAGVEKYSPRGNVSLRGSRASDSACRCSCNFRLKTHQTMLYYNHYTKENRNL